MPSETTQPLFIATRRGRLLLALVCFVALLDFTDGSIVNVALPSIRHSLHFSVQSLQWVLSGYLLTYGGFLLLGGRAADLLGRRRMLVGGTALFAICSLAAGVAQSEGVLIGARLVQGLGAAMMSPAALSILTTSFREGQGRHTALGAFAAMAGLGGALGVFLGGVLSQGPGWRWVFFVNLPLCALVLVGAFRLLDGDRRSAPAAGFDAIGAVLATGGMLILIYALVKAPTVGWGKPRTIAELAGAAIVLTAFVINELRHKNPILPLSIFRNHGLAAANGVNVLAFGGMIAMFYFTTLYMQDVLRYSPIKTGVAYLPFTVGLILASGVSAQLLSRIGTRPLIALGALVAAAGLFWLSRLTPHASYVGHLLPPMMVTSIGVGMVFVSNQNAANGGVPPEQAGLAAALINTSGQTGAALGLAVLSAIATGHTNHLLAAHESANAALASGFERGLLAASVFLVAAAAVAFRAPNIRGENAPGPSSELVAAPGPA